MGLDHTIQFPAGGVPAWKAIRAQLARIGEAAPIRMIDGMPAFPDEDPPADWRELRVGTASGMVTLRRGTDSLTCVVWSNADSELLSALDRVAWACAAAGSGLVSTPMGPLPAEKFAEHSGVHPV
jgi:hypothetical protein